MVVWTTNTMFLAHRRVNSESRQIKKTVVAATGCYGNHWRIDFFRRTLQHVEYRLDVTKCDMQWSSKISLPQQAALVPCKGGVQE